MCISDRPLCAQQSNGIKEILAFKSLSLTEIISITYSVVLCLPGTRD